MASPPRMLVLQGGGAEALLLLPVSYDKAVQAAYEKFNINKGTHDVRLTCRTSDIPWIGPQLGAQEVFIADNDSYHYACAGKAVVRLGVVVFEKNAKGDGGGSGGGGTAKLPQTPAAKPSPAPPEKKGGNGSGTPGGNGGGGGGKPAGESAQQIAVVETTAGKNVTLNAVVSGNVCDVEGTEETLIRRDLKKGIPAGNYLGTLTVEPNTMQQRFVGRQLGPNEVFTKYVVHDKSTARLLFRPRSIRPQIDLLYPEEKSLEVTLSVADWTVISAYPMTQLQPEGSRQRLRWFLKVKGNGIVEDLLTGTETSGLFVEMLPAEKPRPAETPAPGSPLIPSWPDIRPETAWCLPQSLFIPHIDRVLLHLGLPVESRTQMITSWLPSVTRHKNIAYRILGNDALKASSTLTIIPPPDVLVRIFIIFKGVPDGEMKSWENKGILQAEMGLDWRPIVGWNEHLYDEDKFRVFEYGAMEVFD